MRISNNLGDDNLGPEDDSPPNGDSGNFYLEYESDLERGGSFFTTMNETPLIVLTKSHKNKNFGTST